MLIWAHKDEEKGAGVLGFLMGGILLVILDQVSKWLATYYLHLGESVALPGHLVYLTLVHNPGAAFGLFANATSFLVALALALLLGVWWYRHVIARQSFLLKLGLTLSIGGAVGNVIDRIRLGYVVDFIDVRVWPVFNVADCGIVIGVAVLFWLLITAEHQK
ncbi:MAG: signal peptidase II [Firmicutes bacterium]|nr:signal peptidase II [Bacillota bacterium]